MSKDGALARIHDRLKADTDNTTEALRLQAKAWRICAMIATHDPVQGATLARWLLFQTVPWVNGEAVSAFIARNQQAAEAAGKASGVFDR